jgi:hypothetical protein
MILFGSGREYEPMELWSLDLAGIPTWAPLATEGTTPSPRFGHAAVYDRARDRLLVYGGNLSDRALYELSLRPTLRWRPLQPAGEAPQARAYAGVVLDPRRDRLLSIAGRGYCQLTSECPYAWSAIADTWQFEFDPPPVAVPPLPAAMPRAEFALDAPRPNPAVVPTVSFALADGSPARLEAFDMSGRRMLVREVGMLGAGRHAVQLTEARGLRPGVYVVRLTQTAGSLSARMVVMK